MTDSQTPNMPPVPPPPMPNPRPVAAAQPAARAGQSLQCVLTLPRPWWRRALSWLMALAFTVSIVMNVYLAALVGAGFKSETLATTVIAPGKITQTVAVYPLGGVILGEQVHTFRTFTRQVIDDKSVVAVVLRVESPGGSVSASDQIYEMVRELKAAGKKIVISMGGVAASGGYYISAPGDIIYAEPTTITGSIGVIAMWPVMKGTLTKLGMDMVVLRSSGTKAWKAAPNNFEFPAQFQMDELQRNLDQMQQRFEGIVKAGRGGKVKIETAEKTYTSAESQPFTVKETSPFNGRIFTGEEAKALGLVDEVGYLKDAIDAARKAAGAEGAQVLEYTKRKGLMESLVDAKSAPVIDLKVLDEIQTPRIMMLWKVEN